jgi:tellurite methyltransferase
MFDKEYWENYYAQHKIEHEPSLFARYIKEEIIKEHRSVIELGCGNGRDAVYFANHGFYVTAIDQVSNEIEFLKNKLVQIKNLTFKSADFTKLDYSGKFDITYSRFTIHAITEQQEEEVIFWTFQNLNPNGKFCIEVRGQKNEIFGKGTPVENQPNAFIYNEHYRRFLNFDIFLSKLKNIGFIIDYAAEEKGFAPFNGEDETFIRIIATKN